MRAVPASPLEGRQENARVEETTTAKSAEVLNLWKQNAREQSPDIHQSALTWLRSRSSR